MKERLTWEANSRRRMIMAQTVDVVAIFDRMIREPKPVRFKIYDGYSGAVKPPVRQFGNR